MQTNKIILKLSLFPTINIVLFTGLMLAQINIYSKVFESQNLKKTKIIIKQSQVKEISFSCRTKETNLFVDFKHWARSLLYLKSN